MISPFNFILHNNFHPISTPEKWFKKKERNNRMENVFFCSVHNFHFHFSGKIKNVPYMKQTEFLHLSTFKSSTCEGPWIEIHIHMGSEHK